MSVRAYKVIEIKTEPVPTFNLWHNCGNIMDYVDVEQTSEGGGLLYFSKDVLVEALKDRELMNEDTINTIEKVLADIPEGEFDVEYYCF